MTPENPSAATRHDWYPVARAVDLEHPQQVTLLGRRLVAFRTADGRPRVLLDRCLHRGGTLHRGAVIGDSIECPYHGWQWRGADGQCVYIPPNGRSAPIPKAARIAAGIASSAPRFLKTKAWNSFSSDSAMSRS